MTINKKKESSMINQLDIRGKVCPMTFVYTKLKLEGLNQGEFLEVLLDFPAALKSIPENCKRQKLAELLEIKKIDTEKNTWSMKLKKV